MARLSTQAVGRIGLVAGLVLALGLQLVPPPEGLTREAWIVASLGLLMASWWATEAIPIPATSLLPLVVLPASGVLAPSAAAAPYANPIVILFMGGFIVALGLERWRLHARIALNVVARAGGRPRLLILGFMVAAALLSMWISNTATTLMMTPIALSVAQAEAGEEGAAGAGAGFAPALLLSVAYAASIGGIATPVGSPTNLAAIGFLEQNAGLQISFAQWMALGVPVAVVLLPAAWFVLTRWALKIEAASAAAAAGTVRARLAALGPLTMPEARLAAVFAAVALAWIFRQPVLDHVIGGLAARQDALAAAGQTAAADQVASAIGRWGALNGSGGDAAIAIAGALALFLLPAGGAEGKGRALMDWETAGRLPWGVLLLFGGGLSLAGAIQSTGLAEWLGGQLSGVAAAPGLVLVLALVAMIVYLTELTSNAATVTAFMPVVAALALDAHMGPAVLAAPAAIAGSCAFMFPVGTPPNAIVYATGRVSMMQMIAAGFRLNLLAIVTVTAAAALLADRVFG